MRQVFRELAFHVCVLRSKPVVCNGGESVWKIKSRFQILFLKIVFNSSNSHINIFPILTCSTFQDYSGGQVTLLLSMLLSSTEVPSVFNIISLSL